MKAGNEKVVYYYYDKAGNRRIIAIGDMRSLSLSIFTISINEQIKHMPILKNNYYVQIDAVEFKLD